MPAGRGRAALPPLRGAALQRPAFPAHILPFAGSGAEQVQLCRAARGPGLRCSPRLPCLSALHFQYQLLTGKAAPYVELFSESQRRRREAPFCFSSSLLCVSAAVGAGGSRRLARSDPVQSLYLFCVMLTG